MVTEWSGDGHVETEWSADGYEVTEWSSYGHVETEWSAYMSLCVHCATVFESLFPMFMLDGFFSCMLLNFYFI